MHLNIPFPKWDYNERKFAGKRQNCNKSALVASLIAVASLHSTVIHIIYVVLSPSNRISNVLMCCIRNENLCLLGSEGKKPEHRMFTHLVNSVGTHVERTG